jgi:hypothetical protein
MCLALQSILMAKIWEKLLSQLLITFADSFSRLHCWHVRDGEHNDPVVVNVVDQQAAYLFGSYFALCDM